MHRCTDQAVVAADTIEACHSSSTWPVIIASQERATMRAVVDSGQECGRVDNANAWNARQLSSRRELPGHGCVATCQGANQRGFRDGIASGVSPNFINHQWQDGLILCRRPDFGRRDADSVPGAVRLMGDGLGSAWSENSGCRHCRLPARGRCVAPDARRHGHEPAPRPRTKV